MRLYKIIAIIGAVAASGYMARADLIDGAAQVARNVLPPVTYTTGRPSTNSIDCFRNVYLGGNAQFTLTIGPSSLPWCKLKIYNIDSYSGPGSGRGKRMSGAAGITAFWLYPGQEWSLSWDGVSGVWRSDQALAGGFGMIWYPSTVPQFFMDTGTSADTTNDGLASGVNGAFKTPGYCVSVAYSQVYTRSLGSVQCSQTAGQTVTTSSTVQVFYPIPGGGTFQFTSATPGSVWTWNCPAALPCIQFGDGALLGISDIQFVGGASISGTTGAIMYGHNLGVLDVNGSNIKMTGNTSGAPLIGCDFDAHFNINNGISVAGTAQYVYYGCQNSSWDINGTQAISSGITTSRYYAFQAGSHAIFEGNVTFPNTGLFTGSAGVSTGNAVVNNLSGSNPYGGAGTTITGGQYCTPGTTGFC